MTWTRRLFTLVELAISVAIVATLAAIAIPTLHAMQMKARASEIAPNAVAIGAAGQAYLAVHGVGMTTSWNPAGAPGKAARSWNQGGGWSDLGFQPDGPLRASYFVHIDQSDADVHLTFDMDGDGDPLLAWGEFFPDPRQVTPGHFHGIVAELHNGSFSCYHAQIPWLQSTRCGVTAGAW